MQLLQVCQNIADVLEAERVQARRITTLYAGSLIWAEKDSAYVDSSAAARPLQPGWRRVFLPDGMGGLREGYMRSRFLEPCQGQERWRKWAPQRSTVLTERIDAVSQSEPKEQEDADALRSEEAFRKSIVQTAYSYLGTQYRWGGKTACGIDCSGLAFMSYFRNGILIWRDAAIKEGYPVHEIPIEQAKPGDLLFFPGHVAIYLGNGRIIHATGHPESSCVTVNSLWEGELGYREDLKNSLCAAGSIF
ncbi:NlpC/P60 family protein [Firmicutes bacterium TM09-10]|nr:NlpC/P60 family protein [Firmicutes bacterium AF36-19BH]RHU25470.1 NlpC/P60 family protein [Firmicutes bacterium TM09-10]